MSFGSVKALELLLIVLVFILSILFDAPEGEFFNGVDGLVLIENGPLYVVYNSLSDLFEIGVQHPSNKVLTNT